MLAMFQDGEPYDLDDKIDFGKHEGQTIRWIMENDNSYLVWLVENVEGFDYTEG